MHGFTDVREMTSIFWRCYQWWVRTWQAYLKIPKQKKLLFRGWITLISALDVGHGKDRRSLMVSLPHPQVIMDWKYSSLWKWDCGATSNLFWNPSGELVTLWVWGSVQFSSVAQSCPTLWDPTNCSTPGLPVHHQLPEFTQTHVHRVSDAIQPSHPLSSPSPAPNPSQHQSLFQWVNSSHELAKVLEFQL